MKPTIALVLTLCTGIATLFAAPLKAQGEMLEEPPVFEARTLLVPEQLRGPHHWVDPRVENDGAFNHFTVHSDFGTFHAPSEVDLEILLSEIEGIAILEDLSRREVFADALVDVASQPVDAVTSLVEDPQGALEGLPKGLARTAKGLFFRARKAAHDVRRTTAEMEQKLDERRADGEGPTPEEERDRTAAALATAEEVVKRRVGFNAARRRLAQRAGVDPYTRNPELSRRLDRLARVALLSELGFGRLAPDIGLVGLSEDLAALIWEVPREELQRLHDKELGRMGVPPRVRFDLFDNSSYSPTELLLLVRSLQSMAAVGGRDDFVGLASAVESAQQARFFARAAQLLAKVHRHKPLSRLRLLEDSRYGQLVFATSLQGETIVPAPVDHLLYRRDMQAGGALDALEDRELWVTGDVSDLTRTELKGRGWRIETRTLLGPDRSEGVESSTTPPNGR